MSEKKKNTENQLPTQPQLSNHHPTTQQTNINSTNTNTNNENSVKKSDASAEKKQGPVYFSYGVITTCAEVAAGVGFLLGASVALSRKKKGFPPGLAFGLRMSVMTLTFFGVHSFATFILDRDSIHNSLIAGAVTGGLFSKKSAPKLKFMFGGGVFGAIFYQSLVSFLFWRQTQREEQLRMLINEDNGIFPPKKEEVPFHDRIPWWFPLKKVSPQEAEIYKMQGASVVSVGEKMYGSDPQHEKEKEKEKAKETENKRASS